MAALGGEEVALGLDVGLCLAGGGVDQSPESPSQHDEHDEVYGLGDAMPDAELEFGILPHFIRIGLGFDHGRGAFGFDLELIFLLVPDGELWADPFATEQGEAKQDDDVEYWLFGEGSAFFQPIGEQVRDGYAATDVVQQEESLEHGLRHKAVVGRRGEPGDLGAEKDGAGEEGKEDGTTHPDGGV